MKERIPFFYNIERKKDLTKLESQFVAKIISQLKSKQKNFKVKLWNDDLAQIIAEELITQILSSRNLSNDDFKAGFVDIPVNFSFGAYALQYIRYKNIYQNKSAQILTFN